MTDSRTADKFVVRLPDGMRSRLAEVARENHRSMNSEIVVRLADSLDASELLQEPEPFKLDGNPPEEEFWSPRIGALVEYPGGYGVVAEFFLQRGQVFVELDAMHSAGRSRATVPLASVRPVHHRVSKDFT